MEQPARRAVGSLTSISTWQFAVPGGVLAVAIVGAMKTDGYGTDRFSPAYRQALANMRGELRPAYTFPYVCQRQRLSPVDVADARCILGPGRAQPSVLLWGDSNAAHYVGMLAEFANVAGFRFRNVAVGACPPVLDLPDTLANAKRLLDCRDSTDLIKHALADHEVIVLSASWTGYAGGFGAAWPAFERTIVHLLQQGKRVVLIGKAPEFPHYDRRCREKALRYPVMSCANPMAPMGAEVAKANAHLAAFAAATPGVDYFDVTRYLCPAGVCTPYEKDGQLAYFDASHLAMDASWRLGRRIVQQEGVPGVFRSMAARPSNTIN